MNFMDSSIEQQRALYGMPLAERFGYVMDKYALSQRSLAAVLGLSAPMLSQLISGKRIKIGNPAVNGRLMILEAHADDVDLESVLEKVSRLDSATATQNAPEAAEFRVAADYLAATASVETLRELAQVATARGEQRLAGLLHKAAGF